MAKKGPRYSKDEFEKRGDTIYETKVRPNLKMNDLGTFAAIDIETGDYEIASKELTACHRLEERMPDAQIWLVRIGSRYLCTFGGHEIGGHG